MRFLLGKVTEIKNEKGVFVTAGREKKKKKGLVLLVLILAILVIAAVWVFPRLEKEAPTVTFEGLKTAVGDSSEFSVKVSDHKSGLKRVSVTLLADGKDHVLAEYADTGTREAAVHEKVFDIALTPKKMGVPDGKALVRVLARDYSWRHFLKGNQIYIEKEVAIDTHKPEVEVLSRQHYINQGGAGVVVYRIFEPDVTHGVMVGDDFFPGYAGQFADNNICLAFFAVAQDQPADTSLLVSVTDQAGNVTRAGFYHLIKNKSFAKDRITISDTFLNAKMPEFDVPGDVARPIDKFKIINSDMRARNNATIRSLCGQSDNRMYWQGAFLRFPNSAPRAGFADHRSYVYNGQIIGQAVHMGIDLASTANSPVPAANAGRIAFTGSIGIYGRTVIIDHGLGLFSLYSHLSHIAVSESQMVEKGEIIGRSGMTGLAGGDHLHYGMLIHDTFVNPIEWWDASWIANNVSARFEAFQQALTE